MSDGNGNITDTKAFLIEALRIPDMTPEDIADDEPLFGEGLGLDSIDVLTLVVAIQKKYGIKVPDASESRPHFENVRTLSDFIHASVAEKESGAA